VQLTRPIQPGCSEKAVRSGRTKTNEGAEQFQASCQRNAKGIVELRVPFRVFGLHHQYPFGQPQVLM
jgi:hypothetical protein